MTDNAKEFELFSKALDALYKASLSPDGGEWHQFTGAVQRWLNVEQAAVVMVNPSSPDYLVAESTALSPEGFEHYLTNIHSDNVWVEGIESRPLGRVYRSGEIYPNDKLVETRFYDEYLKDKQYFHAAGGFFHNDGSSQGIITIYQNLRQGCLSVKQSQQLQQLFPHLKRAYDINHTLFRAKKTHAHLTESLSRLGKGLILLDDCGRLIEMNAIAENLSRKQVFRIRNDQIMLGDKKSQLQLEAALCSQNRIICHPEMIFAQRTPPTPPLVITVIQSEISSMPFAFEGYPKTLLLIHDPAQEKKQSPELLQYVWELTGAEARLATHLAEGLTLRQCAETFQVTYETARSQLKCIFYKSDTHSQNELISLINTMA